MADTLSMTVNASVRWLYAEGGEMSTPTDDGGLVYDKPFADGTGASQVTKVWRDTRTIAGSGVDNLDLTVLSSSWFGNTLTATFTAVQILGIINTSTTAGDDLYVDTTVTNSFVTPFNSSTNTKVEITAGGMLLMVNRLETWAVAASIGDILQIENDSANSVTYRIVIAGQGT